MSKISSRFIRVGHSPDPDDAFMFYALAKQKIDMRGFEVEHVIEGIESLNQRALNQDIGYQISDDVKRMPEKVETKSGLSSFVARHPFSGSLEVTAVSCHAYAYLADRYVVMRSGASVGYKYGPVLVTKQDTGCRIPDVHQKKTCAMRYPSSIIPKRIAIPGKLTTAHLVLQLFAKNQERHSSSIIHLPDFEPVFVPFDRVFDAVKSGEADLGLVIHEGQITHAEHGLKKVLDLGTWWYEKTQLPLPLGIDIIRRDLGQETIVAFSQLFKESIEYALNHREDALKYASQFGRGISHDLNDRFVAMYVNDRTVDIGSDGEAGFRRLLDMAYEQEIIPHKINLEFI